MSQRWRQGESSVKPAAMQHCATKINLRMSVCVHAHPCFSMLCMHYQCVFCITLHAQASGMVSRLDKRRTACRIVIVVRTRLAEGESGIRAVIALCERYGGAALARADRPTVWHATLPCTACPRMRCPRPARARGPSPGGAQRSARRSAPHAPRCRHRPTVCLSNVPLVYCHINSFQQASRLARPSQGGKKRTAVWASHQEEL